LSKPDEGKPMVQVLVAEDVGIISIALEDALIDAGYGVAGPFGTCAKATEWLNTNQPDLGLLDSFSATDFAWILPDYYAAARCRSSS
jgi:AmiR/NasT family two-component response regulator